MTRHVTRVYDAHGAYKMGPNENDTFHFVLNHPVASCRL